MKTMKVKNKLFGFFFLQAGAISPTETPAAHFEPQVAILCESGSGSEQQKTQAYHSQYMTEQGKWITDINNKATCLKDKMDILDYCKKVKENNNNFGRRRRRRRRRRRQPSNRLLLSFLISGLS